MENPKTVFETIMKRDQEQRELFSTALKEAEKKTKALERQLQALKVEQEKDQAELDEVREDYWKLLNEPQDKIEKEVRSKSITQDDVKSRKRTLREFMEKGKDETQIQAEVREIVREKVNKLIPIAREKRLKIMERQKDISALENDLAGLQLRPIADLKVYHENRTKQLQNYDGAEFFNLAWSKYQLAKEEFDLASKGSYQVKYWTCKGIREVNYLLMNPIIREEHLEELKAMIEELEKISGIDGTPITVYYTQVDGHPNLGRSHFRYMGKGYGGR